MNANEYEQQVTSLGNIIARLTRENDKLRNSLGLIDAYIQINCLLLARQQITAALDTNEWRNAFREGGPDPDRHDDSDGCAGRPDDDEPEYDLPF